MAVVKKIILGAMLGLSLTKTLFAGDDLLIYSDQRNNGWDDWGWVPHYRTNNPVHSENYAMVFAASSSYQAWWLKHNPIDTSLYTNLTLWVNGGTNGGQYIGVQAELGGSTAGLPRVGGTVSTNSWVKLTFSLASLGVANKTNLTGFQFWNGGTLQSNYFIDDITLVAAPAPALVRISLLATQTVRTVDAKVFGINQVAWDGNVYSATSLGLLGELGNPCLRWPGGSWGDGYHWTNEYRGWGSYSSDFIKLATNTHAQAFIIVNYGSSDAAEAAFGVRMFNVTNKCNFKYWEIGNEVGGSWETDNNTNAPWKPHDAWTYAMRFTNYYAQMKAVDPTIRIGAVADVTEDGTSNYTNHPVVNPRTGVTHNGWTPVMLTYMRSNNVLPDFLILHKYPAADGDTCNLLVSSSWSGEVASLRQMVTDYLGSAGTNITLECTENGSTSDAQSVSLVGGLLYADSLGQVLQTELNSRLWWDLRNGGSVITNSDPALYGWRTNAAGYFFEDGGVVYNAGAPTNRYPKFYAAKLMTFFARGGDAVVKVSSDHPLLAAYAAKRTNGTLSLLVINKSSVSNLTAAVNFAGYVPTPNAVVYSYGIPQDDAARTGVGSPDLAQNALTNVAINFTNTFAPYSATVLSFNPAPPPVITVQAAAAGKFIFQLTGQSGAAYVLQNTTNLNGAWNSVATNTLLGLTVSVTNQTTNARQFWRAFWR